MATGKKCFPSKNIASIDQFILKKYSGQLVNVWAIFFVFAWFCELSRRENSFAGKVFLKTFHTAWITHMLKLFFEIFRVFKNTKYLWDRKRQVLQNLFDWHAICADEKSTTYTSVDTSLGTLFFYYFVEYLTSYCQSTCVNNLMHTLNISQMEKCCTYFVIVWSKKLPWTYSQQCGVPQFWTTFFLNTRKNILKYARKYLHILLDICHVMHFYLLVVFMK